MKGGWAVRASAPGKVILVGEHAVVYGRPAIAVPVWQKVATAVVSGQAGDGGAGGGLTIVAQDIGRTLQVSSLQPPMGTTENDTAEDEPLVVVARNTLAELGFVRPPGWRVTLSSELPIASGLGSGAALCAALARGLWQAAAATRDGIPPPDPARISALVYAAEEIYHGTPSGIDNTVVSYGLPVWFRRGEAPERFTPSTPFWLAIGDSGRPGSTRGTVAHVRSLWGDAPDRYEAVFDAIGELALHARAAIEQGNPAALGPIFDANHAHLQTLEVSTPALDRLVLAAREAGALGAKLSGGGGGGNMIALVSESTGEAVGAALQQAGAARVILTRVGEVADDLHRADRPAAH